MGIFSKVFRSSPETQAQRAGAKERREKRPGPFSEAALESEGRVGGISEKLERKDGASILEAIGLVRNRVDDSSREIQKTVLNASSEQNSVIQGIYRLIDQRTMERSDYNKKRRETWRVISEALSDFRLDLNKVGDMVKEAAAGPEALQELERLVGEMRSDAQISYGRLDKSLGEVRELQARKLDDSLGGLRSDLQSSQERLDRVLLELREAQSKKLSEALTGVRTDVRVSQDRVDLVLREFRDAHANKLDDALESIRLDREGAQERLQQLLGELRDVQAHKLDQAIDELRGGAQFSQERLSRLILELRESQGAKLEEALAALRADAQGLEERFGRLLDGFRDGHARRLDDSLAAMRGEALETRERLQQALEALGEAQLRRLDDSLGAWRGDAQAERVHLDDVLAAWRESQSAKLDGALSSLRAETQASQERIDHALVELREAQWLKLDGMLGELRQAEKERIDKVLGSLREEAEKRVEEVRRLAEVRVFDAIRTGDERVIAQKEILRGKLSGLEEVFKKEIARLEAHYRGVIHDGERQRRESLLGLLDGVDAIEAQLDLIRGTLEEREKALAAARAAAESASEDEEAKKGFFEKLFGRWDGRSREKDLASLRLDSLELAVLDAQRLHRAALEEVRRQMVAALGREGIEPFDAAGERFQDGRHVKVESVAVNGKPAGIVLVDKRRGYLQRGEVFRPADVVVSR